MLSVRHLKGFYIELSRTLIELGCRQSRYDPALFLWWDREVKSCRMLKICQLDVSGNVDFKERIVERLKEKFIFGSEIEMVLQYVWIEVDQREGAIMVYHDHYMNTIKILDAKRYKEAQEVISELDQKSYRTLVKKISQLSTLNRLDVSLDHVVLSRKFGKAK